MASADFCTRIPTPCDVSSTKAHMQISPGIAHVPSRLCLSDIRRSVPCKYRASQIFACLPRCAASYPLPVRQASALPSASSGFAVARDTLAVRLALLLAECAEDFHLQVRAPCRAHKEKVPRESGPFAMPRRAATTSSTRPSLQRPRGGSAASKRLVPFDSSGRTEPPAASCPCRSSRSCPLERPC